MPKTVVSITLALTIIVLAWSARGRTQSGAPLQRPCAEEATAAADAVAALFDDRQFVFIGSTHGDLKIEEFLTCLVSRPAFTRRVTDIVVEQVSSAHQATVSETRD